MSASTHDLAALHPSPHRDRVSLAALFFGLGGGALAWVVQLLANYVLASYTCFPNAVPRTAQPPLWPWIWDLLLAINIIAMLVALKAATVAWRNWQATRGEHPGEVGHLLEAGEGRTRFISAAGLMADLGFFAAIAFDTIALIVVPTCIG